jgi:hypothetical protein
MPTHALSVNTSVLPLDVLSFYDDQFYHLVETIAGAAEASLLEVQGIRSVYSFLNTEDVFEILSVQCLALSDVRKLVCLEKIDKTFTVKPGCRSSILYLSQLLNRKHEENMKEIGPYSKRSKQQQQTRSTPAFADQISQDSTVIRSPSPIQQQTTQSG